jgi:uncharacterized coiled-coil protein SlyX
MLSEQNNIDQIRQIIFGEQIQKYEKKFDELLETIEKNAIKQKKEISDLSDSLAKAIDSFKQSQDELNLFFEKKMNEQSESNADAISELKNAITALEDKTSNRHQLGDILIEMGMRLKGEDLLQNLSIEAKSKKK